MKTSPHTITTLAPNEIFVFGSNLQGSHGAGAARAAHLHFGAIMGQGVGLQGQSYAIPTMQGGVETVKPYIDEFIDFAKQHPELTFLVTRIGCGIAGFKDEEMAPLFQAARDLDNVLLPKSFVEILLPKKTALPLPKHLFILDFEATCNEPNNPFPQEVIEFPIVVVDTEKKEIVDEFHFYVKPTIHPILTDFCVALTGISQKNVDDALPFTDVYEKLNQWMIKYTHFTTVTCGHWDLGTLFPMQCQASKIEVPCWAKSWINIKDVFAKAHPQATPKSMMDMLQALNIEHIGRHHSGIDDARNIAHIAIRLLDHPDCVQITSDWICPQCATSNTYNEKICKCGKQKNSFPATKLGDWSCPKCGFMNFERRNRCMECNEEKSTQQIVMKPGDWICSSCNGLNFAKRSHCFQCGVARWQ